MERGVACRAARTRERASARGASLTVGCRVVEASSRAAYDRSVPSLVLAAVQLFANAVFNLVAWPRFYPRIANDPRARGADGRRTAFYTVHVVLITIALVLAAASAVTGVVILL